MVKARQQQAESDYLMAIQFADAGYRNGNLDTARSMLKTAPQDHRGWEWNYLNRLCQGDHLHSFEGNGGPVTACEFNHDGTLVITASGAKTVEVWDARTGQLQFELQGDEGEQIAGVSFSPDGRRILTDSYSGRGDDQPRAVKVWDAKSGKLIMTLYQDPDWVYQAAFSPDSKWIVTTHREKIAKVWDADTGAEKVTLRGHTDTVNKAVFIRNSTRLVTTSDDKTARVWDIETGMEVCKFEEHTGRHWDVACSPADDGRTVATDSWGQEVRVWDSETGKEKFKLGDDSETLYFPRFSPDGTRMLTNTRNPVFHTTATVREIATGRSLFILPILGTSSWSSYSPDGTRIITSNRTGPAQLFDAESGRELLKLSHPGGSARAAWFTPDGRWIVMHDPAGGITVLDGTPLPEPTK